MFFSPVGNSLPCVGELPGSNLLKDVPLTEQNEKDLPVGNGRIRRCKSYGGGLPAVGENLSPRRLRGPRPSIIWQHLVSQQSRQSLPSESGIWILLKWKNSCYQAGLCSCWKLSKAR